MERPHHYWGPFAITSCSSAAETSGDRETSKKKKCCMWEKDGREQDKNTFSVIQENAAEVYKV